MSAFTTLRVSYEAATKKLTEAGERQIPLTMAAMGDALDDCLRHTLYNFIVIDFGPNDDGILAGLRLETPERPTASQGLSEALDRVRLMASGDSTWDLSPNDIAALTTVLAALDAATMSLCAIADESQSEARCGTENDGRAMKRARELPSLQWQCENCLVEFAVYAPSKLGDVDPCTECPSGKTRVVTAKVKP